VNEKRKYYLLLLIILIAGVLIGFSGLFLGRFLVPPKEVLNTIADSLNSYIFGIGTKPEGIYRVVVMNIRLPRILLNIIVGASLAVAGTAYQGIFCNQLVSPDVLGVSAGAGFGASLGIILTSSVGTVTTSLALAFGLLSVFLTFTISKLGKTSSPLTLVLSGMIVSSVFNALISLMKFIADVEDQLPVITFWLLGSFSNTTYADVISIIVPVTVGILVIMAMRWKLNILSLGDEEAHTLGVDAKRVRTIIIVAATVITAACVTVTGIITWVGLVLPNICRILIGSDHRYLLPLSCVSGSIFMIIVDLIARTLTAAEIPIGVLTALVGAPFFAFSFYQMERN